MYTMHGHQIPGTTVDPDRPFVHRCGGPDLCSYCAEEVRVYEESVKGLLDTSFPDIARKLVFNVITAGGTAHPTLTLGDVYLVWFSKTLRNWKALISTTIVEGRYYEVTHDGDKNETYIDTYVKVSNDVVHD
jgi:hypothetical protein